MHRPFLPVIPALTVRLLVSVMIVAVLGASPVAGAQDTAAPRANGAEHAVLDSLGAATPDVRFSIFGSGGFSILSFQNVGPEFELTRPTVITEIGAFVNNCASIVDGVPQCPNTKPFVVDIRPAQNGRPDPNTVLATFELSHDNDPFIVSYESVRMRLRLRAGTYFALIRPGQVGDQGVLLRSATDPFPYLAGQITNGVFDPTTGASSIEVGYSAARILAVGK